MNAPDAIERLRSLAELGDEWQHIDEDDARAILDHIAAQDARIAETIASKEAIKQEAWRLDGQISALTAERDAALEQKAIRESIPPELAELLLKLGPVEWGATEAKDAAGHGSSIENSVNITAEYFNQEGPQQMHGLYLKGLDTVLCHTGTSPNSGNVARILTAAWNWMIDVIQEENK